VSWVRALGRSRCVLRAIGCSCRRGRRALDSRLGKTVDRFAQLTSTLSRILDTLAESAPKEDMPKSLEDYIECCRQFCAGGAIRDYPDWLERLRKHSMDISSALNQKRPAKVAQAITTLIEEASYGATDESHTNESERILRMVQSWRVGKGGNPPEPLTDGA
jgi:hypothetical protein